MKKILSLVVGAMIVGSFAFAADSEKSASDTTDTSKNPITGTITKTTKMKRKVKAKHGASHEAEVTDTVKTKTNGATEETVKATDSTAPTK
jgi:hypothetical protein